MPTHTADDGTVRQDYYGAGEQPWDTIVRLGWAAPFAAGNILKYLRRDKAQAHSLESARWYRERLNEMVLAGDPAAVTAMKALGRVLTPAEVAKLR